MFLPDFDYYAPGTLSEACTLLAELGPDARVLAGGTDLMVKMKQGLWAPTALVSLKHLDELRDIRYESGRGVVIGALSTHNDLYDSPLLHERFLSVSLAAHQLANPQVRNRGTVGGNLVNAIPSADLPPLLIALDASLTLVSTSGSRTVMLKDFFTGPSCCVLEREGEIVTEIVIPDQATTGSTYIKFGLRRSGALAVVGVAAAVTMDADVIREARICLGAVYPTPVRAYDAENMLAGKPWSDELLRDAGYEAACCAMPIDDIRASADYRRAMVEVFTRRALKRAITKGHA
jgi:carbon-monoxide dehydrogenase medium subunit